MHFLQNRIITDGWLRLLTGLFAASIVLPGKAMPIAARSQTPDLDHESTSVASDDGLD
jgi:hypothetical protein